MGVLRTLAAEAAELYRLARYCMIREVELCVLLCDVEAGFLCYHMTVSAHLCPAAIDVHRTGIPVVREDASKRPQMAETLN